MSFINIINESFDKRNKSILTESKLTQLRKAFGEVSDSYDTEELLSSIFPQFARKAYKIVKNHGYSGVFSEIDTQGDLGDDFFYANKDGKSYMGSYNYQQELDDITEIVLFGKATTYKELIDDLAEWYANLILSKLEFDSDEEWDESEWVISEGYTKSSKSKVTKNKALHEYFDYREAEDFDELGDMLDQSGDLIREAAEKLGFKDFEWEDSVQGPYGRSDFWITSDEGTRLHAMVDFSETWVTDLDEAIDLLNSLDWEDTSDGGDNDEVNDDLNKLKSLSYIPESFFSNSKIKSIDIPGNIKSIKREAFSNCKKLEDITFSVGLKDIGEQAFYGCTRVEFIDFPESLTTISDGAFMDCKSLISITIPTSVKSIGDDAFSFCPRLYEIRYNGTHQDWQQIKLGKRWAFHSLINIIECTDGTLRRSGPDPTICDWVFNEKRDLDESIFIKKQKRKSQKLKEAAKKVYKYIVVDHFSPEDFYLVKSNHPVDENMFDAWNFLDVTDKHGKGTVIWNDEYIDFNESGNKSIADLDDEYRKEMVRYLSDLEKNGNLDKIKDDYLSLDELQYQGYLTDFPVWIDPGDGDGVVEDYMNDKTLKNSYLATMYSDYLENSYVDNDSSSAAVYIDIDDLTQYMDYEEFFDEDDEDED